MRCTSLTRGTRKVGTSSTRCAAVNNSNTEPICRYLAEVEMRLHLTAEDVEASLQEQSRDALYRIPAAVQELSHAKVRVTVSWQIDQETPVLSLPLIVGRVSRATSYPSSKGCTSSCNSSTPMRLQQQTVWLCSKKWTKSRAEWKLPAAPSR